MKWFWRLFYCKHENKRCIHGDEIIARNWCRVLCRDCGKALKDELPEECYFTGRPHKPFPKV